MKNLSIKSAVKLYKECKARLEALRTPEVVQAEREFDEVKTFIADYAKAQGAFSLKGVNVEVTNVLNWDTAKLEALALKYPQINEARKVNQRATIRVIN